MNNMATSVSEMSSSKSTSPPVAQPTATPALTISSEPASSSLFSIISDLPGFLNDVVLNALMKSRDGQEDSSRQMMTTVWFVSLVVALVSTVGTALTVWNRKYVAEQIIVGVLYLWSKGRRLKRHFFGDPLAERLRNAPSVVSLPSDDGDAAADSATTSASTSSRGTRSSSRYRGSSRGRKSTPASPKGNKKPASPAKTPSVADSTGDAKPDLGEKIKGKVKRLFNKNKN
ncbi:unnamed protein product [Amoebophrya sp. A25]|nr:unnamed protein product [Amoebophrya sp. A25]|eukprot:GSA25T00005367001.1